MRRRAREMCCHRVRSPHYPCHWQPAPANCYLYLIIVICYLLFVFYYCLLLIVQSVFLDSAVRAKHRSSKLTVIKPQPPAAAQLGSCRVVPTTGKSGPVSRHSESRVLVPKQVPAASRLRRWLISRGNRPRSERVAVWSPCQTACTVSSQVRRVPGCSDLVLVGTHCFRLEAVHTCCKHTLTLAVLVAPAAGTRGMNCGWSCQTPGALFEPAQM